MGDVLSIDAPISIHAPLAGCDPAHGCGSGFGRNFNPRTPCGVRPFMAVPFSVRQFISIHAPLAGCDPRGMYQRAAICDFNPRTPCGVRPIGDFSACRSLVISIHAPLAGCDLVNRTVVPVAGISIHAPLAGCDHGIVEPRLERDYFNPRTPCGVRRARMRYLRYGKQFQSTHPLRGATFARLDSAPGESISIHAPLAGCDMRR